MIDLREGLRARIAELREQRAELEARLKEIQSQEQDYQRALTTEDKRYGRPAMAAATPAPEPEESSLRSFVFEMLGSGPKTLEAIRDAALERGMLADSASPGRSVQGVLSGLARAELIAKNDQAQWYLVERLVVAMS